MKRWFKINDYIIAQVKTCWYFWGHSCFYNRFWWKAGYKDGVTFQMKLISILKRVWNWQGFIWKKIQGSFCIFCILKVPVKWGVLHMNFYRGSVEGFKEYWDEAEWVILSPKNFILLFLLSTVHFNKVSSMSWWWKLLSLEGKRSCLILWWWT